VNFWRIGIAGLSLALCICPGLVQGQQLRLHGVGAVAHAVGDYQDREFSYGGTARAALEWMAAPKFGIFAQASGTWLAAGAAPQDPTLARTSAASSYEAMLGLRLYPFSGIKGIWLSAAGGLARTGGAGKYAVDSAAGVDLVSLGTHLNLGPMVGWEHVFQPDRELRPEDANVVFLGVHAVFGVAGKPKQTGSDADADGIVDSLDQCPKLAEDKDGFADSDGCPDTDNDQDGILDQLDRCPNEPEDKDGYQDDDGCPDLDNDADGIPDSQDACPNEPEDKDGFADSDGCPDTDNDQDGILDQLDRCPNEPEDKDGYQDDDGCPDLDNDADGIPDSQDACPNEPETVNGYADTDGCPDAEQIRVVGDKIVLDERVHFSINSHTIDRDSYPLLERLAQLIKQHPEYAHIEAQGHTDVRGPDVFNNKLSLDRAYAVIEFLASHGVKRWRLSARGFGKSKPLIDESSEYGWQMNRRVEFQITRKPASHPEPTEPGGAP
jgi:outer membrane protein OmpA-like peptidoglycan-associated protein